MSEPKRRSDPLELLRTAPIGVATPSELEEERARLVPWLEEQVLALPLERRRAQARRRRWIAAGVGLSAAAVALLVFALGGTADEGPTAAYPGEPRAPTVLLVEGTVESGESEILSGSRLGATSRVRTAAERTAVFQADAGYRLQLAGATDVVLSPSQLRLLTGKIELSVPKLPPGQTLEVFAFDTTVRVRGTRFSVELVQEEGAPRVCVRVSEGLVEVEEGAIKREVRPGQSAGCASPEPALSSRAPEPSASQRAAPSLRSSLAEENRWLTAALAAERAGRLEEAKRSYQELLRRYPRSRFSPEARAGLERVEKRWSADAPR